MIRQPTKQDYIDRFIASGEYVPTTILLKQYWTENLNQQHPHLQFSINDVHSTSKLSALFSFVLIPESEYIDRILYLLSLNPSDTITDGRIFIHILDTRNINHFLFFIYYYNFEIQNDQQYITINKINSQQIEEFIGVCRTYRHLLNHIKPLPTMESIQAIIQQKKTTYTSLSNMFSGLSISAPGGGGAPPGAGFKKYLKYKAKYLQLKNQLN